MFTMGDAIGSGWAWLAAHGDIIIIQTVNGIVTGMILALIASGLTLIFGIMDVVNFAHGELFMLGAYVGVVVLATSGSFWLALVLSTLVVALIGAALQIITLRPLIGRDPLNTILATFGISLVCRTTRCGSSALCRASSTSRSPGSSFSFTSPTHGIGC